MDPTADLTYYMGYNEAFVHRRMSLRITSLSESEKVHELACRPIYYRRANGVRGRCLYCVVFRLVDPVVATSACAAQTCTWRWWCRVCRTHWLARACRRRIGLSRDRGRRHGQLVRLLLCSERVEYRRSVGRWLPSPMLDANSHKCRTPRATNNKICPRCGSGVSSHQFLLAATGCFWSLSD